MKNVLFICGKNRLRSPTAEALFAHWPGIAVASAGVNHDADCRVDAELLQWADIIIAMERRHRSKLQVRFRAVLNGKPIICLGIPDDYEYMAPALVAILEAKVPRYLPAAGPASGASRS
ncbi:low molecular weight protein tyrosine phosphatase family protein [Solimonas marina]|uniref:Phosphotyrosine protein phosphatase n=1 Tax=Solimonas marina TaxID=2714601 RepID=A0A970B7P2_9GAMM|nr:low molecular weight protein tyrosine phosphatase family protein [Solimonas marina]NKF24113.1 phosphotyrosine protein phosphatase [Solimonas marina]